MNWWEVQVRIRSLSGEAGEQTATRWMKQARIAIEAFTRCRGRPARLNLGDCFAYALARAKKSPLLYKGKAFNETDLPPVG